MAEGSLWVYGQTRLTDYYAGRMGLRELLNRFISLPPEAPIWDTLRQEEEAAERRRQEAAVTDALTRYRKKG